MREAHLIPETWRYHCLLLFYFIFLRSSLFSTTFPHELILALPHHTVLLPSQDEEAGEGTGTKELFLSKCISPSIASRSWPRFQR